MLPDYGAAEGIPFLDSHLGEAMRACHAPARAGGHLGCQDAETAGRGGRAPGPGGEEGAVDVLEGHIVVFARGTHASCSQRSRCIVNTAEVALALDWAARRLQLLQCQRGAPACGEKGLESEGLESEGRILVRGGVEVVRTEDRSHSFLQLVALLQGAAVIVAPHGTQVCHDDVTCDV